MKIAAEELVDRWHHRFHISKLVSDAFVFPIDHSLVTQTFRVVERVVVRAQFALRAGPG